MVAQHACAPRPRRRPRACGCTRGDRKSTAALPSTTAAPITLSSTRTHSGATTPGSATSPRSPSSTFATDSPAPTSFALAKVVSSQVPTSETTTTPTTKSEQGAQAGPARGASGELPPRDDRDHEQGPGDDEPDRVEHVAVRPRQRGDPADGRQHEQEHDERPPGRAQPPAQADTEREQHRRVHQVRTIGTAASETGSSLRSKKRFSGGTSHAITTTVASTNAKVASQSGHRSSFSETRRACARCPSGARSRTGRIAPSVAVISGPPDCGCHRTVKQYGCSAVGHTSRRGHGGPGRAPLQRIERKVTDEPGCQRPHDDHRSHGASRGLDPHDGPTPGDLARGRHDHRRRHLQRPRVARELRPDQPGRDGVHHGRRGVPGHAVRLAVPADAGRRRPVRVRPSRVRQRGRLLQRLAVLDPPRGSLLASRPSACSSSTWTHFRAFNLSGQAALPAIGSAMGWCC